MAEGLIESTQAIDIFVKGNLESLKPEQLLDYYVSMCKSLGLNHLTRPFQLIKFDNKTTMYLTKDGGEQLRKIHDISITSLDVKQVNDIYIVIANAKDKTGRTDSSTGAVSIAGMKGIPLANAIMKAETKAKRRVALSLAGLGILDESELDGIPNAQKIEIDPPLQTCPSCKAKGYSRSTKTCNKCGFQVPVKEESA